MTEKHEEDGVILTPRDEVYAAAEQYKAEQHAKAVMQMKTDIAEAVETAKQHAEETGKVYFDEENLIIPDWFMDEHGYYIPDEVKKWAADAGYTLGQGTGKRYYIK